MTRKPEIGSSILVVANYKTDYINLTTKNNQWEGEWRETQKKSIYAATHTDKADRDGENKTTAQTWESIVNDYH